MLENSNFLKKEVRTVLNKPSYMTILVTSKGASFLQTPNLKVKMEPSITMLTQLSSTHPGTTSSKALNSFAFNAKPVFVPSVNHDTNLEDLIKKTTMQIAFANNCLPYMIASARAQQQMVNFVNFFAFIYLIFFFIDRCKPNQFH